jgi:hypothetical protein
VISGNRIFGIRKILNNTLKKFILPPIIHQYIDKVAFEMAVEKTLETKWNGMQN